MKRVFRVKDEVVMDWTVEPTGSGFVRIELGYGGMTFKAEILAADAAKLGRELAKAAGEAAGGQA